MVGKFWYWKFDSNDGFLFIWVVDCWIGYDDLLGVVGYFCWIWFRCRIYFFKLV